MTSVFRHSFVATAALSILLAALGTHPAIAAEKISGDVTLEDGPRTVVLSNGIVSATISKSSASVSVLKFRGFDMLKSGYYSMDGGKDYRNPSGCKYYVKTQTPDLVDIGMTRVWKNEPQAFDIDVHYVLRRGDSGLYSYATLAHPAKYPATRVGEWRMVWKLSEDTLERIYVDDLRHWEMQSPRDKFETTGIKEIIKVTSGVRAGKFDCKYDYSANYWNLGCWGHASNKNKVGAWIVLGSHEFFNDGPTKQDLNAASGINHIHFGLDHYNASTTEVAAGKEWKKIYGPFLLYCNYSDQGGDGCWADAKARAKTEEQAWPYAWLTGNDAYPQEAQRGKISGAFAVKDPLKPQLTGANAWIGVAQPPPEGNWQFESMNYQFWAKTDAKGNFTIPHVRPGVYTLYAFVDGAVGEFSKSDVRVEAGKTTTLDQVVWNVPHKGSRIAWEIGIPDRTAKEFRHGNDYFQGYLWMHFDKEFANPLEYYVGKSNWATDWNYAQSRYGDAAVAHVWKIHFDLAEAPAGDATLTLAIASADRAKIVVKVNDDRKPLTEVTPSVQGGNALLREGIHAKYCVEYVKIPADRLKAGPNVISLSLANPSNVGGHVMYDYLNLELP